MSHGARRRTSRTESWCCRATSGAPLPPCTRLRAEVDDIADGTLPDADKRDYLERLHEVLETVDSQSAASIADRGGAPWAVALADSRTRFAIPLEALHALVDGGLQDIDQSTYADFADLRGYCEKVAGAVGLACVPSTAPTTPSAR